MEGLFTKYARAVDTQSVPGRQASDNTWHPKLKNQNLRGVLCAQSTEKKKLQCTATKYVIVLYYNTINVTIIVGDFFYIQPTGILNYFCNGNW